MPWTPSHIPTGLSERLSFIIAGLCEMVGMRSAKDRGSAPLMGLICIRLHGMVARFAALAARARSGGLPAAPASPMRADAVQAAFRPRPPRPSSPYPHPPHPPSPASPRRLPQSFAWLIRLVPATASLRGQVEHLLADPEMAALAAVPQVRRLLRPLCRMLGIKRTPDLPEPLAELLWPRRPRLSLPARAATPGRSCPTPRSGGPALPNAPSRAPGSAEVGAPAASGAGPPLGSPLDPSLDPPLGSPVLA